jgi:hypothetical protein
MIAHSFAKMSSSLGVKERQARPRSGDRSRHHLQSTARRNGAGICRRWQISFLRKACDEPALATHAAACSGARRSVHAASEPSSLRCNRLYASSHLRRLMMTPGFARFGTVAAPPHDVVGTEAGKAAAKCAGAGASSRRCGSEKGQCGAAFCRLVRDRGGGAGPLSAAFICSGAGAPSGNGDRAERRAVCCTGAAAPGNKNEERDEALIVFMQNLLDSPL